MRALVLLDLDGLDVANVGALGAGFSTAVVVVGFCVDTAMAAGTWSVLRGRVDAAVSRLSLRLNPSERQFEWALAMTMPETVDALLERLVHFAPRNHNHGQFEGVIIASEDKGLRRACAAYLADLGLTPDPPVAAARAGAVGLEPPYTYRGRIIRRAAAVPGAGGQPRNARHRRIMDAADAATVSSDPGQYPIRPPMLTAAVVPVDAIGVAARLMELEPARLSQYGATAASLEGVARLHPDTRTAAGIQVVSHRAPVSPGAGMEWVDEHVIPPILRTSSVEEATVGIGAVRLPELGLTARCRVPASVLPDTVERVQAPLGACWIDEVGSVLQSGSRSGRRVHVEIKATPLRGQIVVRAEVCRSWQQQVPAWWFPRHATGAQGVLADDASSTAKPVVPWSAEFGSVTVAARAEVVHLAALAGDWRLDVLAPVDHDLELVAVLSQSVVANGVTILSVELDGEVIDVGLLAADVADARNGRSYAAGTRLVCRRLAEVDDGHPLARLPLVVPVELLDDSPVSDPEPEDVQP